LRYWPIAEQKVPKLTGEKIAGYYAKNPHTCRRPHDIMVDNGRFGSPLSLPMGPIADNGDEIINP